jgi:hypothetical protein
MNQATFKKSVQNLFKQQEKLLTRRNRKLPQAATASLTATSFRC